MIQKSRKPSNRIWFDNPIPTYTLVALFVPLTMPFVDDKSNADKTPENYISSPIPSSSVNDFFPSYSKYYIDLSEKLKSFEQLGNNWNGYGSPMLQTKIISNATSFLSLIKEISSDLSVFPTARNSIQFEFETINGLYSEAEIFSEKIEIYFEYRDNPAEYFSFNKVEDASKEFLRIHESRFC
ncbi:MAG: hypothetical protein HW406_1609 [Candidatus Brocadiaceae bacterium]|nr:hypothetical protein [Candidatus Brocadiaceae bacterium]